MNGQNESDQVDSLQQHQLPSQLPTFAGALYAFNSRK